MAASTTGGLLLCLLVLAAMATELPETYKDDHICSRGLSKDDQSCSTVLLNELHGGSLLQTGALQSTSTDEPDDGNDDNTDFGAGPLSAAKTQRRRRRRRKSKLKPVEDKLANLTKIIADAFGGFDTALDAIEKKCAAAPTTATQTTTKMWKCGNLDAKENSKCKGGIKWGHGNKKYNGYEGWWTYANMGHVSVVTWDDAKENSKCKGGIKWGHGNKKYNGYEGWWTYANMGHVSVVTWDDATLEDFQRLSFCDPRGGKKCGLPPCSCTSPPCDVCPKKIPALASQKATWMTIAALRSPSTDRRQAWQGPSSALHHDVWASFGHGNSLDDGTPKFRFVWLRSA
eukprot:gnl/TRDRNA2_/TRDRNA2_161317_c0_seq1.p1 gnl/TRDRNA2_/TRDRNA2_161317_c0~~gnl/TRDRNA2_/TRDRNA2_161317_c0_seq1.p1  ORF type:complete len:343 (-),score=61.24 gnl/TRDRNA2_/TRDRNA2_161317_c0_seq1:118-1146(-)